MHRVSGFGALPLIFSTPSARRSALLLLLKLRKAALSNLLESQEKVPPIIQAVRDSNLFKICVRHNWLLCVDDPSPVARYKVRTASLARPRMLRIQNTLVKIKLLI